MSAPERKMALVASNAASAQEADRLLRARYGFVPVEEADMIVALGGDGFLLHILRERLNLGLVCPVFGMNRGTVGFLMNDWGLEGLDERLGRAKRFEVSPLRMETISVDGTRTDASLPLHARGPRGAGYRRALWPLARADEGTIR